MDTSVFNLKRMFLQLAEDVIRMKEANKPAEDLVPLLNRLKQLDEVISTLEVRPHIQ